MSLREQNVLKMKELPVRKSNTYVEFIREVLPIQSLSLAVRFSDMSGSLTSFASMRLSFSMSVGRAMPRIRAARDLLPSVI